jgi:Ca-activated chloride channel homolog
VTRAKYRESANVAASRVQRFLQAAIGSCVTNVDNRHLIDAMGRIVPPASLLLPFLLLLRGQADDGKDFKFTANSDLVLLDVSVKDNKGGFASQLKKENFQIYENGKLQTISVFGKDDTPITVGLVLDDSRSMRPKRGELINSALAFIDASNPRDEMFVTHFNDRVRHGLPPGTTFSDDLDVLRNALFNNPAEGRTALYDGILDALQQLDLGKQDKKSLVIITDGGDNASSHQFKDVVDVVQSTRAILYTVGVFDSEDPDRNPGLLRRLANISGGVAYLPENLDELPDICRGIAKDIRNRYSIGYIPVRANDKGGLRNIKVSIIDAGNQKFTVHARTSYSLPPRSEVKP